MSFDNLIIENIKLYAIKCYSSPHCIMSEFEVDFKHVKYIKRLFKKYKSIKDPKERLILNHIICLSNVFGVLPTVRILFFYIDEIYYTGLKTYLEFLNYMPDIIFGINGKNIVSAAIPIDHDIFNRLKFI